MFHAIHNGVSAQLYPNSLKQPLFMAINVYSLLYFAIENGTASYVYPLKMLLFHGFLYVKTSQYIW